MSLLSNKHVANHTISICVLILNSTPFTRSVLTKLMGYTIVQTGKSYRDLLDRWLRGIQAHGRSNKPVFRSVVRMPLDAISGPLA